MGRISPWACLNACLRAALKLPEPVRSFVLPVLWRRFWERERQTAERNTGNPVSKLNRSERVLLIEKICDYYPLESLLELGVGYAQNFHTLGPLLSETRLVGVDRDENRIQGGEQFLIEQGIKNARLIQSDATDLKVFESASFDLVISCGFLLYLEPAELCAALREAVRVARRALVFVEQHEDGIGSGKQGYSRPGCPGRFEKPYWVHDFHGAFREAVSDLRISVIPIPCPVWSTEEWRTHAHLIVVDVSNHQHLSGTGS